MTVVTPADPFSLPLPPLVVIEVGAATPEARRSVTVVGTAATAQLAAADADGVELRRGPPGDPSAGRELLPAAGPPPLLTELAAFLGHLRGGPPPMSSAAEGAEVVERVAEVRRAAGLD